MFKYSLLCAFVLLTNTVQAQSNDQGASVAGYELLKEKRLWSSSSNAAGIVFDDTHNYSNLNINYDYSNGDFHRVYTGNSVKDLNIYTEGFINLEKVFVWGEFKFTHEDIGDARFNASITDPYRGQPYFVVDSGRVSNWRNQNYQLRFRAATPLQWEHWSFGVEGIYKAQLTAKQRDPRTDSRFYTLQVVPGVVYAIGNHRIGVNVHYASIKEESSMTLQNAYVYQPYFELYGLGTASSANGTGRTTNYFGDRWGLGVQYGFNNGPWNFLAEIIANKYVENTEISFTTPKKDGQIKEKNLGVKLNALYNGEQINHHLVLGFNKKDIDGIMFLSQRNTSVDAAGWDVLHADIRSTYATTDLFANYSLMRNRGNEYDWRVDIDAHYQKLDDKFILPLSVKNSKNLYLNLDAKKNFKLSSELNRRFLVDVNVGLKNAFNGTYEYNGSNSEYITVHEMEPLDEAFLIADAWNTGVSLAYSQQLESDKNINIYAKTSFNYQKTKAELFNNRKNVVVTLGFNF